MGADPGLGRGRGRALAAAVGAGTGRPRPAGQGKTTAEIAAALLITENTVRTHVGNLLGKPEVDSREAAIAWAWKHGFVEEANGAEDS
ncbi:MAG: LuxR C-terminal-related transcriptional regulator [Anaerolineae bacterium]